MDRTLAIRLAKRHARELARTVLDVVAPSSCVGCGVLGEDLCEPCRIGLERREPPRCDRCGAPLGLASRCTGSHTRLRNLSFARAPFGYAGTAGAIVRRVKFQRDRGAGLWLAHAMADTVRDWARGPGRRAVLVPVPLHNRKLRARGIDQAELLAVQIARAVGLRCLPRVLARVRATMPQGDIRVTSRDANVAGAFRLRKRRAVRDRCVVLVDDVLTSGSTMRECARVLLAGGAAEVVALTACDARG